MGNASVKSHQHAKSHTHKHRNGNYHSKYKHRHTKHNHHNHNHNHKHHKNCKCRHKKYHGGSPHQLRKVNVTTSSHNPSNSSTKKKRNTSKSLHIRMQKKQALAEIERIKDIVEENERTENRMKGDTSSGSTSRLPKYIPE